MKESINRREMANLVKQRLYEQNLTLRKAAVVSDISFSTLSKIQNSKTVPDIKSLIKLSKWLDIPIDQLLPVSLEPKQRQLTFDDLAQPESKASIEVHFRGKRKKLESSSAEVKETLVKMMRLAYRQFFNRHEGKDA